ncbi:MAG: hypothetical protein ACP5Q1_01580 [Anaerolineae bacterium]
MKRWLAFLFAVLILLTVHEGIHALMAMFYGEFEAFHIRPIGFEVTYRTAVDERSGMQWAFISGAGNLVTLLLGYLLLMLGEKLAHLHSEFVRASIFYLTLLALLSDPFNLSVGPYIYGGDANGMAIGLGINRYIIQAIFFVVLIVNRELVAQNLFSMYNVKVKHILFQPWIRWTSRAQPSGK